MIMGVELDVEKDAINEITLPGVVVGRRVGAAAGNDSGAPKLTEAPAMLLKEGNETATDRVGSVEGTVVGEPAI
jgi:hypothetical protein